MKPGTQVGHYEIISALGKGGMGEVWRARDTKLGREVAIKTLPPEFADDPDRLVRFEREAKLLASLNHPNIAAIYGLEEDDGTRFLVLELVEGDTLADRLRRGAIPEEEALALARQIADAVEAAHEKGVIHRDLKPANIKITPEGAVKVLDFGLAKALAGDRTEVDLSNSPTLSIEATRQGLILGTAGYMSPEQAKGNNVDRRADIWAFGCILYEMLTGKPVFGGESVSEILAAVLKDTADLEAVPRRFRRLLGACLERDPNRRLRHIGDMQLLLDDPVQDAAEVSASRGRSWLWPAVAGLILVAAVLWVVLQPEPRAGLAESYAAPIPQPADIVFTDLFSLSPDGKSLAILATTDGARHVVIHDLGTDSFRPLSETRTENPIDLNGIPIWSPDNRSLAYWRSGVLRQVDTETGESQPIAPVPEPLISGFWVEDYIVFATADYRGLWQVNTSSGNLTRLTNGPDIHPSPLPDGRFLYVSDPYHHGLRRPGYGYYPAENGLGDCLDDPLEAGASAPTKIFVGSIGAGPCEQRSQEIASGIDDAVYVEGARRARDGYLLLLRGDSLSVQRFDLGTPERVGEPQPFATGVSRQDLPTGVQGFVFPTTGFAATRDQLVVRSVNPMELAWFDLMGNPTQISDETAQYVNIALSGNGERMAAMRGSNANYGIWVRSLTNPESSTFLTGGVNPVLSADGQTVAYGGGGGPGLGFDVHARRADGTGEVRVLYSSAGYDFPAGFSHDGRYLLVTRPSGTSSDPDIWLLSLDSNGDTVGSVPLIATADNEGGAEFSNDSTMIAYQSTRDGQTTIYVRAFDPSDPDSDTPAIAVGPGQTPRWSGNAGEVFYRRTDGFMVRVRLAPAADGNPIITSTEALFEANPATSLGWDVHPDGDRFIMAVPTAGSSPFTATLNWMADLDASR